MRLVSHSTRSGPVVGLLRGDRVHDIGGVAGEGECLTMRELLAREADLGGLEHVGDGVSLAEAELLPPVPDPEKIVCIGLNYRSHAAEAGIDPPESPTFFAKFANALTAAGGTVPLPPTSSKVDYEAEVAVVIGRRASAVGEADAMEHVAGYTLLNDLSARDLQFATPQWMPGKVFDGSAPCGPALVTPEEAGAHDAIELALHLNGEQMQSASTADLIFSVPSLVSRLSALMTLEPGDVIATGTPSGVGGAREPSVWLKAGDEVVVSSPTLGELRTTIAAPARP